MTDDVQTLGPLPRLTESVRQQLLDQNEGLTFQTSYRDRNFHESRTYTVTGGELLIRAHGKGPFGGSHFDTTWVADAKEVHRALYHHQRRFNHTGVDPKLKLPKPETVFASIPDDVVDGLVEDGTPQAQSRVAEWFQGLSTKEKLAFGGVVVAAVAGGVVVYRFRRPISAKMRNTAAAVRRKFDRRSVHHDDPDEDHTSE